MIDRYRPSARFTLTALSLLLIVWSVLGPVFATSTPAEFGASADRLADAHLDTLDSLDNIGLPVDSSLIAWSPVESALTLTAVIEWAWSSTPPVRPPNSANSI